MESTVKIAYNRDHEVCPVIKIVVPLSLHDKLESPELDVDEKDILVRDFLFRKHTRQTNQWFKIHGNFSAPSENPTHTVSTIKAVSKEILPIEFQGGIIELLYSAGYENSDERFKKVDDFFNWLNGEIRGKKPPELTEDIKVKQPFGDINGYTEQEQFVALVNPVMQWINSHQHPHVSVIIDCNHAELVEGKMVHGREITDPQIRKVLSTNTLRYIYEMLLPEDARLNAFKNTPKGKLDEEVNDRCVAMTKAFDWANSPEGYDYWENVTNSILDTDKKDEPYQHKVFNPPHTGEKVA